MAEKEIVFLVKEAPEGGYTAKAVGESIFTEGEDWEDLQRMVRDAVQVYFEEGDRPSLIHLLLVREETLVA
jgi:hypothetical protein